METSEELNCNSNERPVISNLGNDEEPCDNESIDDSFPKANEAALAFLDSIDLKTLGRTVFSDVLGTVSTTGQEIGELTISVEETVRCGEICYLVHAHSHGIIDNVPCGTSFTAYVGRGLVTIEQTQHEYIKVPTKPLDKKTVLIRQSGHYILRRVITEGEERRDDEKKIPATSMHGFISEGANVMLQRVMAIRQTTPDEDAEFLSFDLQLECSTSTYAKLEPKSLTIEGQSRETFGIERSVLSRNGESTWYSYFLKDGHLSYRRAKGSPVTMQLFRLPLPEDEEEPTPDTRKKEHRWEEDMQFWSRFLDRKEELKNDHLTFIQKHPELKALMSDFLQFLLLRKPDDVCSFAANYFEAFSTVASATIQ